MRVEKVVLIDGNSLINRAFYAVGLLTNKQGMYTNAVYGFTNMLIKVIGDISPAHIAVAFDVKAPTFRHRIYSDYKAGRRPMPSELIPQFDTIKGLLADMNIKMIEQAGIEADDILGTLSKRFRQPTIVLTGDRDALQLVGEDTEVWLTKKGLSEIQRVTQENIVDLFGVDAKGIIDLKSLMGDASDNIPGVPGVGEVTALKLLGDYRSLDGVYEHLDEIKGKLREKLEAGKESAYLSYRLATIDRDCNIDCTLQDCTYSFPFPMKVKEDFEIFGFNSLLKKEALFSKDVAIERQSLGSEVKDITRVEEFERLVAENAGKEAALYYGEELRLALDEKTEYRIQEKKDLLSEGMSYDVITEQLKKALRSFSKTVVFDAKAIMRKLSERMQPFVFEFEDLALAAYVLGTPGVTDAVSLLGKYGYHNDEIATAMLKLNLELQNELKGKTLRDLYELEKKVSMTLFEMEIQGCRVDKNVLTELGKEYENKLSCLKKDIYESVGKEFNLNSPKQLGTVLFEELGLKAEKKTKTGYSTDVEVLEGLYDSHPAIPLMIEYRQYAKMMSTYIEGLQNQIAWDGKIHTEYKQFLTATGRLSSIEPNLQNIPANVNFGGEIRRAFVPSNAQGVLISADYSQIELRLLADFSCDERLIEAFQSGDDIHRNTAALMFGVDRSMVTPQMRKQAKAINFGIIYGKGEFSLAKELHITRKRAKEFIERYFASYPMVKGYLNSIIESAREKGEVSTLLGRIRKMPEIRSSNFQTRSHAERAATNMPLQGSAADIIKIAMVKVRDEMLRRALTSKLILQVHDELIVDCAKEEVEVVKEILKTQMESAVQLKVPLTVEVESAQNWFEA